MPNFATHCLCSAQKVTFEVNSRQNLTPKAKDLFSASLHKLLFSSSYEILFHLCPVVYFKSFVGGSLGLNLNPYGG